LILQAEGERGSRSGEIAFGDREDAAVRIVRISGEEKPGAGGADDADTANTTIERVGTPRLIEVTDDNDGAAGARGDLFQRREGMTEVLIGIATPSLPKIGNQRIEDDEGGAGVQDHRLEQQEIGGEGDGTTDCLPVWNCKEREDALGITTGGIDARADGVEQIVFGGAEKDIAWGTELATGEGIAAGDASSELTEEGALAEPGIAVEDGELASRHVTRPEPAQWFRRDVAETDQGTVSYLPCLAFRGLPAICAGRGGRDGSGEPQDGADEVPGYRGEVFGGDGRERGES